MPESRQQPYYGYAIKKLPKDEKLAHLIAEYLHVRISKNPQLSMGEWQACIDELETVFTLPNQCLKDDKPKMRQIKKKPEISVTELRYLFMVAIARKWNHVYFSREQDMAWERQNFSYYQDPYWQKLKNDPESRKILEEQLTKCKNEWKD